MAITTGVYTTREDIKRALDIAPTARQDRNIDRCIESAARRIDGICHRIFYPRIETKYFDWPNAQQAVPWRLWLDDTELISVTSMTSGGVTIPSSDYILEPNRVGPPYNRVEINISTSSAFSSGSTHQRSISITGLWGYNNDEDLAGTITEALDASETALDVDAATASEIGVGALLRIDSERLLVTNRTQLDTGQTLGGSGLTNNKAEVLIPVGSGAAFMIDEIIKIGAESMLVTDITGNNLTVVRAYDGSVLASHTAGTAIYAPRTLTVRRGVFGTTAAAHLNGSSVYSWRPPPGIRQFNTEEAIHELMQEQTGWFRTMSASSNFGGTARRAATMEAILDFREQMYRQYGRKARTRAI